MSVYIVCFLLGHFQWFGNLVTMKWWNDLWLNEGFASFMENVGVNHVAPEWKMMDQFLLDKFQVSMSLDQLTNSHPIMAQVRDPAQINSLFDSISYDKVGTAHSVGDAQNLGRFSVFVCKFDSLQPLTNVGTFCCHYLLFIK